MHNKDDARTNAILTVAPQPANRLNKAGYFRQRLGVITTFRRTSTLSSGFY
ncbi:hypothetical protein EHLJMEHL_03993 [Vreelandella titanicae]|uniref:Uncharacterized protein n=1 Tax=Vreelandella titanicae TaxID=664683 RepID=A0AAP9SZY0_9GAMM|nr:hypothetical protein FX987_01894 [Halomonas titanicae]SDI27492.1 hypothetical protein SAMN04487867_10438 [Halomonas titanicae]